MHRPPGGGLTFRRGVFRGLGPPETMMSACYGRSEGLVFSGAATGDVYVWKEPLLLKKVKAHDGPVFAMFSLDKVRRAGVCVSLSFHLCSSSDAHFDSPWYLHISAFGSFNPELLLTASDLQSPSC